MALVLLAVAEIALNHITVIFSFSKCHMAAVILKSNPNLLASLWDDEPDEGVWHTFRADLF